VAAISMEGERMPEYKVLTEGDSRFAGKFNTESLEAALNAHAAEGWRVVEGFLTASTWKSANAQIVVILERSKS
jgi:Domain of unknown function (DUF4177)